MCIRDREKDCHTLLDLLAAGEIPLRVTHNDTKINNVLIDAATGKGICVIDLDTVMPGLSAYDFGDSIRTGANDCAEDEPDQSKVHFDLHLYEVFAKGYLSTAGASMSLSLIHISTAKVTSTIPSWSGGRITPSALSYSASTPTPLPTRWA